MSDKKNYDDLPEEVRPISPWRYFGLSLLYSIPIIGFIFLMINSLRRGNNVNIRNYSRSYFCGFILVLTVVVILIIIGATGSGLDKIRQLFS